jgi:hypothetical protein
VPLRSIELPGLRRRTGDRGFRTGPGHGKGLIRNALEHQIGRPSPIAIANQSNHVRVKWPLQARIRQGKARSQQGEPNLPGQSVPRRQTVLEYTDDGPETAMKLFIDVLTAHDSSSRETATVPGKALWHNENRPLDN